MNVEKTSALLTLAVGVPINLFIALKRIFDWHSSLLLRLLLLSLSLK
jgi:hypothetical protein